MATVVTIDGITVDLDNEVSLSSCTFYKRGSYPVFSFQRRGIDLPDPDPYEGKSCVVTLDGTIRFRGRVTSTPPSWTGVGWVASYQALGQRWMGDLYPFIQESDGMNTASFNLSPDDSQFDATRAGRTVGQILTTCLGWATNTASLTAAGIVYNSTTQADLDTLVHIPPRPVTINGDKLISAIEGFLDANAPNYALYIEPADGTLRFLNMRDVDPIDLTMGSYEGAPPVFGRDTSDCRQAVMVKGTPWTIPALVSLLDGGLSEDFGYVLNGVTVSNGTAKSIWTPDLFQSPSNTNSNSASSGVASVSTTTVITIDPADALQAWPANFWDQSSTGRKAWVFLFAPSLGGAINQFHPARIVSNTALTAGGTCTITIDSPLNAGVMASYTTFAIYGMAGGLLNCWRKYKINNSAIVAKLADRFQAPVPFVSSVAPSASLTTVPAATIIKNGQELPATFVLDKSSGHVYFDLPTSLLFRTPTGAVAPDDIRVMLAVYSDTNNVRVPASGFEGTSYTQCGLQDEMTIFLGDWRDPLNKSQVQTWAQNVLDCVKDIQLSGSVEVYNKVDDAMSMGCGVNLIGSGYSTGYETANIPIVGYTLMWEQPGAAHIWTSVIEYSNRCNPFGAEDFMTPQRPWATAASGYNDGGKNSFVQDENFKTYTVADTQKQLQDMEEAKKPKQQNQEQEQQQPQDDNQEQQHHE